MRVLIFRTAKSGFLTSLVIPLKLVPILSTPWIYSSQVQDGPSSRHGRRSRSRSPSRHPQTDAEHKPLSRGNYIDPRGSKDARGSQRLRSYAPIYVIDVQSMYRRLMQTDGRGKDPPGKDVASTARELLLPGSTNGWCAGNECG